MMTESEFKSLSMGEKDREQKLPRQPIVEKERKKDELRPKDTPIKHNRTKKTVDNRLPHEINEIIQQEWNRKFTNSEVSDPIEFIMNMELKNNGQKKKEKKFSLPHIDESMEAIERLKRRYQHHEKKEKVHFSEEELNRVRKNWFNEFDDILQGTPEKLPPLREVNHEINLIDEEMKYKHHMPRCPASVRAETQEKLN